MFLMHLMYLMHCLGMNTFRIKKLLKVEKMIQNDLQGKWSGRKFNLALLFFLLWIHTRLIKIDRKYPHIFGTPSLGDLHSSTFPVNRFGAIERVYAVRSAIVQLCGRWTNLFITGISRHSTRRTSTIQPTNQPPISVSRPTTKTLSSDSNAAKARLPLAYPSLRVCHKIVQTMAHTCLQTHTHTHADTTAGHMDGGGAFFV